MLLYGFLHDKGNQLIRTEFMPFSFFLFILFFPPNNLIQHSVNSDNKCIFFFCMGGRITILLLCKQDVLSGKYSINLAFANGRNPVLQQLCRKSNVLSYSCGIVSISTRAFFCSLSITFPANMRCAPSSLSSVVVSTAIRSTWQTILTNRLCWRFCFPPWGQEK